MRRRLLVAGTALSLLGLGACTAGSTGASPSPSSGASPSAGSTGPVSLRLSVYGDPQTLATFDRMAGAWNDDHPDEHVTVSHAPDAATAARRLEAAFARGDAPDLFLADHEQLPELVARHRVQPVDELLEKRGVLFGDNFQRLGLEGFSADSALQCMPHDVSPLVVFYNTRLLKVKNLASADDPAPSVEDGWTWDQFVTAARRMSRGKVKGVFVPPDLLALTPLLRSAGADVVDDDRLATTLTLSDDGTRKALAQVLALTRDRAVTPTRAQLVRPGAVGLFEDGRLGMMIGTRQLVPKLRETPGLSFDVLPLPTLGSPRTVATMDGYCISSQTKALGPAADFLTFATSAEGARLTSDFGGVVPANLQTLHSSAFAEPGLMPRHEEVFVASLSKADAMPFVPGWPQVEQDTAPLLAKMFYAPRVDLDRLLPAIDARSARVLAPASPSPSP
ncbi:MAG: ABC transporter substrate-binding protein [Nocardioidaceae bacterium]